MSPIPLGILAASGVGVAEGNFELLESTVLPSADSSVEFTNLNTSYGSTYQHLHLRIVARTNRTGADSDPVGVQFNSDGGSNYSRNGVVAYNFGSSALIVNGSSPQTSLYLSEAVTVNSSTAGAYGAMYADILDAFQTDKTKAVRSVAGTNASWSSVEVRGGTWFNTNAITTISIFPLVGSLFAANSRFSLYGMRSVNAS